MRQFYFVRLFMISLFFVSLLGVERARVEAGSLSVEEKENIEVFESYSPSVAFIKNAGLQWDWFSNDVYERPQGAGSGFVWDDQGHIVTNFHVIYQADRIEVTLVDQEPYPAKIVGFSPDYDLAVLKIDAPFYTLKSIPRAAYNEIKVGQRALSISNPFGLDYSMTTGVVSALGRSMRSMSGRKIYDVIQTDAAINPGSSGGPLLNSSGELIGVSTAIYSPSGASAGVGFAIPVKTVERVVPQLIKYGHVKRMGLGVVLVPDTVRGYLGLEGPMILEVQKQSPAERAGLKGTRRTYGGKVLYGDIIVAIDGVSIKNNDDLMEFMEEESWVGTTVEVEFMRHKKKYGTTVEIGDFHIGE